jgi:hypothetical protein
MSETSDWTSRRNFDRGMLRHYKQKIEQGVRTNRQSIRTTFNLIEPLSEATSMLMRWLMGWFRAR